jgi:hypothetical protein
MPPFGTNPYQLGTSEHRFWDRYQAAYLGQPASAQLYELQSQIRAIWTALGVVRDNMDASPNQDACSEHLESLVAAMDELEALADRMVRESSAG